MAVELGPIATRVMFENDRVRVWEMHLAPGEESAPHRHDLDYLIIDLAGDKIAARSIEDADSRDYIEGDVRTGQVIYLEKGMSEVAVNIGKEHYQTVIVELKD